MGRASGGLNMPQQDGVSGKPGRQISLTNILLA